MKKLPGILCLMFVASLAISPCGLHAEENYDVVNNSFKVRGLGGGGGMYNPTVSPYDPNFMLIACDMSGTYRSTDGGKSWEIIHFKQMSENRNSAWPVFFKDRVFWNQGDIIKVSRDQGKTWTATPTKGPWKGGREPVTFMLALPGTPDVLLVSTPSGLFRTEDDGKSWKKVLACGKTSDFTLLGDKVYTVADKNDLSVSADRGKTWTRTPIEATNGQQVFGFTGGKDDSGSVLIASAWKTGVLRSTDEGKTWEKVVDKFQDQKVINMASNQTKKIYMAQNHGGWCKTAWLSNDGGKTWESCFRMHGESKNVDLSWVQTELRWSYYFTRNSFYASRTDPNLALISTQGDFYITRDGGKTWTQSMNEILGVQDGDPGIRYRCTGLEITSCWGYFFNPWEKNREYIAYTDIGFGRTVDNGKTWVWGAKGSRWFNTFYDLTFDPDVTGKMYAACSRLHDIPHWGFVDKKVANNRANRGGVCISEDHGVTWKPILNAGMPEKACTSICLDPASPKDSRTLYATIYGYGVYKSTDGGKTWINKSNGLGNLPNLHAYRIRRHPKTGNLYCLITAYSQGRNFSPPGGIWKSTDGAETWTDISKGAKLAWPTNFSIDKDDENLIYVTAATAPGIKQGGVWKTTDGGANWIHSLTDDMIHGLVQGPGFDHVMSVLVHPDDKNLIYVGTNTHGLLYTKDGGANWNWYKEFPFRNVQSIQVHPDDHTKLYLTTFGGGVWVGPYLPQE